MASGDPYSKIFVQDMEVDMLIGVYDHEKASRQRVIVTVEGWIDVPGAAWKDDALNQTVNYEKIVSVIRYFAERGHINLVETFAERIAEFCLQETLLRQVRVRIEKPDAFASARAVGVEVSRSRS